MRLVKDRLASIGGGFMPDGFNFGLVSTRIKLLAQTFFLRTYIRFVCTRHGLSRVWCSAVPGWTLQRLGFLFKFLFESNLISCKTVSHASLVYFSCVEPYSNNPSPCGIYGTVLEVTTTSATSKNP